MKGASETLKSVEAIVLETSNVEYNKGAPETLEVLNFMDSVGALLFAAFLSGDPAASSLAL